MMLSELLKRLGEIYAERGDVDTGITIDNFAGEIIISSIHDEDVWFKLCEAHVGRKANEGI